MKFRLNELRHILTKEQLDDILRCAPVSNERIEVEKDSDCFKKLRKMMGKGEGVASSVEIVDQPKITLKKLASLTTALLSGDGSVPVERRKKRLEICRTCKYLNIDDPIRPRCGICGCKLHVSPRFVNLLRYEEADQWGCKHPDGSQWKKAGV